MSAQLISTSQRTDHAACEASAGKWLLEHPFLSLCLPLPSSEAGVQQLNCSRAAHRDFRSFLPLVSFPWKEVCAIFFFFFSNSLVFCQLTFFHEYLDVPSLLIFFVLHSCSSYYKNAIPLCWISSLFLFFCALEQKKSQKPCR